MGAEVALILLNGDPSFHTFREDVEKRRHDYYIIAADGGVRELDGQDLLPDLLLGDMDSLSKEEEAVYKEASVPIEVHPVKKDETDGQLALERVKSLGFKEVIFFGALGGRIDQTLANIHLLHRGLQYGLMVSIIGEREILYGGERELSFSAPYGRSFSLLPLTTEVLGLSIKGGQYDLLDGALSVGDTLGLSNRVLSSPVHITCREGSFLLVVEREEEWGDIYRI